MDKYLHWIIVAFAWVWVKIHDFFAFIGLGSGGIGWILSIVVLTIFVRALILPLYLKQIRSSRGMQALSPEIRKLQEKYKGKNDQISRQRMAEEQQALYKEAGVSPFASCLPMLVQMPVIFALYRVILAVERLAAGTYDYPNLGPLTQDVAKEIYNSTFFGASLFDTLTTTPGALKLVFVALIIVMVAFQFLSMRMSMTRNMPPQPDPNNPMVRSQKMMMYMMPAMFIFTGVIFMLAALFYMVTTAVFSWAQQLWVVKVMPTPGSPAYADLVEKRQNKFQGWAGPKMTAYKEKVEDLGKNSPELEALEENTLEEVKKHASRDKICNDFPEAWSKSDQLSVYQTLALEPWKTLPDEDWMKNLVRSRRTQAETGSRQGRQPKKLTKEQRARRNAAGAAGSGQPSKKAKPGSNLTPEEIERRRRQRRAEQRRRGNSSKGSK